jgi:hypothetical protein
MYWWIPLAAGAALGALKNMDGSEETERHNKAIEEENKVEAIRELWSPFTGQHGRNQMLKGKPSLLGDLGSGALAGYGMGQSIQNATPSATTSKASSTSSPNLWSSKSDGIDGLPMSGEGVPYWQRVRSQRGLE